MPVCIAGMHRSGTSMVSHFLNLCGLYMGPEVELSQPAPDNEQGFWEVVDFVRLNNEILALAGGGWDHPPVDFGRNLRHEMAGLQARASELIQRLSSHEPWGWKDPRNSLTLGFWERAVPDLRVVICLRNPLEVARSLRLRNNSSDAFGLNLWLAYNERLLSLAHPDRRVITHYDAYFHDPRAELCRVLEALGMTPAEGALERAASVACSALRHSRFTTQDLIEEEIPLAVFRCYTEMCLEAGPVAQLALRVSLDPERLADTDRQTFSIPKLQLLTTRNEQLEEALSQRARTIETLASKIGEQEQTIASLSSRIANEKRRIQALEYQLEEREHADDRLLQERTEKERDVEELSRQLSDKERATQMLSAQLGNSEARLRSITNTLGWRLLSRYGRLKYRYLLPVYKALGLPPYNKPKGHAVELSLNQSPAIDEATRAVTTEQAWKYKPRQSNTYDVVCFPIIDWDFRYQRPQQMMSRFAAAGHRVFYIAQNFDASGPAYTIRQKQENVFEVSLRGLERTVYSDVLDDKASGLLFASLDTLRRDLSLGATVAFTQLPFWWPLVNRARAEFGWPIVYDCMDHHAGFSTNKRGMVSQERDLLTAADLVVVSSGVLEERGRQHNANVHLIRNACDYEHFAGAASARNERPVIGYYGAIAEWFDSNLVADLAASRTDWDFVLVGSTYNADISRLSLMENVSLPGEKPYSEIPDWLRKYDVAIIPFKRNPLTEATNPVKLYEIFAAGKPLVSVPIPEVVSLDGLLRLASTPVEFETAIAATLLENTPELAEKRRAFAREHTWERRFDVLAPAVLSAFPKASIIVVTYNNLELNRLCLESIYERTEWPNFEVIVVDNASADGTVDYLKEAESAFPNLRVVLNSSNLGFAAANNIGLKLATGAYLVLLNNDTVVTRGWVSALIRHLHANPSIGLIGPVTNAISNEAKIEVGYERLEEMADWAADYIREHDGEIFSISMLAMFCVAMRREVFEKTGYLDERFEVGMFEDDDYCRRLQRSGYELRCARDSFVHHWQRASFRLIGEEEYLRVYQENRKKYESKWKGRKSATGSTTAAYRKELDALIGRVKDSKGAVVFLPSIGWNIHLFQRPHHLAREFARQGYVSIFDSSNSRDEVKGFREIESNLFLFNGPQDLLHEIPDSVLWAFPYNFEQKDNYPDTVRTVYDWIDDLEVFPYDRGFLERSHRRALREASAVVSVARRLHERAAAVRSDAIYLPNGVEYERFAAGEVGAPEDVAALVGEGKPIAGYYGALAEWFDYNLLDEVAGLRSDWNFLLIGQMLDQSMDRHPILKRRNVKWIGPRYYESLPGYLRVFDVATIPFVINNITLSTSPLKLYEYFAGGKAVITTPMPECESFQEVSIARTAVEFAHALDDAKDRGRSQEYRARVRAIAHENSWTRRVQTVGKLLEYNARRGDEVTRAAPVTAELSSQSKPESAIVRQVEPSKRLPVKQEELISAAAELAERFRDFRTSQNQRFFEALCKHFSSLQFDPCLSMYFEFAITSNERGLQVARLLQSHTGLRGKRYLDIGCAYAGFLVAFARHGAQVLGIDIEKMLINLAQHNLLDNDIDAEILLRDATRPEDLSEFQGSFDIITCNDVIEHVDDPEALVRNIAALLRNDGVAYLEIPNRYNPRHVLRDGHYQLFGITLLDYPEAREYYSYHAPGTRYTVRHYLSIEEYARLFDRVGMTFTILDESFEGLDLQTVFNDIAELRAGADTGLKRVPSAVSGLVEKNLHRYLNELEFSSIRGKSQERDFLLRYGAGFWRVLGRKRN